MNEWTDERIQNSLGYLAYGKSLPIGQTFELMQKMRDELVAQANNVRVECARAIDDAEIVLNNYRQRMQHAEELAKAQTVRAADMELRLQTYFKELRRVENELYISRTKHNR